MTATAAMNGVLKYNLNVRDGEEIIHVGEGYHENKGDAGLYSLVPVVRIRKEIISTRTTLSLEYHCFGAGIQIQSNYSIGLDNTKANRELAKRWADAVDSGKLHDNLRLVFTKAPDVTYQKGYMKFDGFVTGKYLDRDLKKLGF